MRCRRSEEFIIQSPGCRQGTILAPHAAWRRLPGSGAVLALGHFGTTTRPEGRGGRSPSRRSLRASDSDVHNREPPAGAGSQRASSARGGSWRTEKAAPPVARASERANRVRATSGWRAAEAQDAGPATQPGTTCPAVTAGTAPDTSGAGSRPLITAVTAPVTARPTALTTPVTAITVARRGERARIPRRRRRPGQRLSPSHIKA